MYNMYTFLYNLLHASKVILFGLTAALVGAWVLNGTIVVSSCLVGFQFFVMQLFMRDYEIMRDKLGHKRVHILFGWGIAVTHADCIVWPCGNVSSINL